ncbi:MAG: aspartate aminotransferase family protein [Nitriliruptor sp.]
MDTDIFEQRESEIRGYCRAYPTVFVSASNARQADEEGRSYIDFFAGAGALNFGHNDPNMKRALIEFIERDGIAQSLDMYTDVKRDFVQAFVRTILEPREMDHKLQFVGPTGSNAVEAAIKLARKVTGRHHVVAFSNGFHGMTLGSLALTANEYFRQAAGVPLEHVVRMPFETMPGGTDALEHYAAALRDPSSGQLPPAAFVVEVIQAEGGVNVASEGWLRAIQDLAHEHDALFIIDDIQAGMGRTGSFFSFDGMDLQPDVVILAKGLGGFGTPIAMNLIRPELDARWKPGEHTGTFRGQGISFVAGRVALSYFEDDELMAAVATKGERMRASLEAIADAHADRGWKVRGRGMMQALDVVDGALAKAIQQAAFESGLLFGPCGSGGRVCKLIPPLSIPDDDLDEGLALFEKAVATAVAGA